MEFLQAATQELLWLSEKEEVEVTRDWASSRLNIPAVEEFYKVTIENNSLYIIIREEMVTSKIATVNINGSTSDCGKQKNNIITGIRKDFVSIATGQQVIHGSWEDFKELLKLCFLYACAIACSKNRKKMQSRFGLILKIYLEENVYWLEKVEFCCYI